MRQKGHADRHSSGQSTVEYILLVTAVIAVVFALSNGTNSPFHKKMTNTVNMTMEGMEKEAKRLTTTIAGN
jgi:hypothetical protein